jgi:hypothetical protein
MGQKEMFVNYFRGSGQTTFPGILRVIIVFSLFFTGSPDIAKADVSIEDARLILSESIRSL